MILCHYLTQDNIRMLPAGQTKEELLKELVGVLSRQSNLKGPDHLLKLILDREANSSTFLPIGLAIPHARLKEISEIKVALGVIPEGFREQPGSPPIYLVLLFFSPTNEKEFGRHLKLLAKISAIFRDTNFIKEVASLGTPAQIFSLIQHKEREIIDA